jgi:hypothetical protein
MVRLNFVLTAGYEQRDKAMPQSEVTLSDIVAILRPIFSGPSASL